MRSKSKKQKERVCVIEDGADNHLGNGRRDWSKSARAIAGLPLHFPSIHSDFSSLLLVSSEALSVVFLCINLVPQTGDYS
jgi:hypothetical protein